MQNVRVVRLSGTHPSTKFSASTKFGAGEKFGAGTKFQNNPSTHRHDEATVTGSKRYYGMLHVKINKSEDFFSQISSLDRKPSYLGAPNEYFG